MFYSPWDSSWGSLFSELKKKTRGMEQIGKSTESKLVGSEKTCRLNLYELVVWNMNFYCPITIATATHHRNTHQPA